MRVWKNFRSRPTGRLHGRTLKILTAIAALTAVLAGWQFAALIGGGEDQVAAEPSVLNALPDSAPRSPAVGAPSPSPTPVETPAETEAAETTASAPPSCAASLWVEDDRGNTVSVTVEVANTGDQPISGWELHIDIEDVEITGTSGMEGAGDGRYAGGTLAPGETATSSFVGDAKGKPDLPATVPCTAA